MIDYISYVIDCQELVKRVSAQNENVLLEQSRNVLLTAAKLGRCSKDNY